VQGIDWCEVIVACMDGPDPDSGTCWECGSVWRRKPVILYRTDIRSEPDPFGPYKVAVTITDRGPFVRGRIIDVTPAAARELGFSGLTQVVVNLAWE
jgi:hypothetical protein